MEYMYTGKQAKLSTNKHRMNLAWVPLHVQNTEWKCSMYICIVQRILETCFSITGIFLNLFLTLKNVAVGGGLSRNRKNNVVKK
jgi:hypothetical protein